MCTLIIGLVKCGRVQWQEAEKTRQDFNVVLIHQHKKFFISELFKVIQDAAPLILHETDRFFTSVDPMNKEHRDPNNIDLEAPRLAWYKQKKWKIHQDTLYWVDIQLALKKGLKFCQIRSNAIILHETLPAYCISKVVVMESGESYTRKYMRPLDLFQRFPFKIIG